jgi:transposase-like protein
MPKGIPSLTEIQKQEIIKRVTDKGERAVDLAKEFKVNPKIIYSLLKTKANQHQAILELAKLERENEALISIIGSLVAKKSHRKKRNKREVIVDYFSSSKKAQFSKSVACAKVVVFSQFSLL